MNDLKRIIKDCIKHEANALIELSSNIESLDEQFLNEILFCQGNIIITGIGKSFLVGQKIAATFSSIRVKSFAVSPMDLLHGSLGLIDEKDIIIVFSNSGETEELLVTVRNIRKLGAKILSITGRYNTSLSCMSDLNKVIPTTEACAWGVIPTTSTTAMMAYGDALAMAIVKYRGITLSEFQNYHPGGAIGKL